MKLDNEAYNKFLNFIKLHYAYPLPFTLSGAYFEEIFALSVNGKRGTGKDLFDVTKQSTGWSLKTVQSDSKTERSYFEVVLKRSDILRDDSVRNSYETATPEELGRLILRDLQEFLDLSKEKQGVKDARIAFLLRNREETHFTLFQIPYQIPKELTWRRGTETSRKSIIGFDKDGKVLRWYRSGTQTFGVYKIPPPSEAHSFRVTKNRTINAEDMLELIDRDKLITIEIIRVDKSLPDN